MTVEITISRDKKSNVERLAGAIIIASIIFAGITLFQIILAIVYDYPPRDATDSATARSNMALRVDYGTGCQYLASASGALTPRMGADGRQICRVSK